MEEQPKKPANPYFLYLEEHRSLFVQKASGNYKQGVSLASAAWKGLPEADKAPYEERARALKEKYELDMKAFEEAGGEKKKRKNKHDSADGADSPKAKLAKTDKDPNAPKKPIGRADGCFVESRFPELIKQIITKPVSEVSRAASDEWKDMSDVAKTPYEDMYEVKKKAYLEASAMFSSKADLVVAEKIEAASLGA